MLNIVAAPLTLVLGVVLILFASLKSDLANVGEKLDDLGSKVTDTKNIGSIILNILPLLTLFAVYNTIIASK